ncbi:MAG: hypothetical protein CSA07_02110 [Bacteroidia bacterium]|nr:MAG: hypothetical protein CSA07_02110 [Bacteroidia bacterium]
MQGWAGPRTRGFVAIVLLTIILLPIRTHGAGKQLNDSWIEYASYTHARGLAQGGGRIMAYTRGAITDYRHESGELHRVSKLHGLSNSGIVAVYPSMDSRRTIVAYGDGTLDLLQEGEATRSNTQLKLRVASGELGPLTHFCEVEGQLFGASSRWLYSFGPSWLELRDGRPIWSPGAGALSIQALARLGERLLVGTKEGLYVSGQGGRIGGLEPMQSGDYRFLATHGQQAIAVRQEGMPGAEKSFVERVKAGGIEPLAEVDEPVVSLMVHGSSVCITTPTRVLQLASNGAITLLHHISAQQGATGSISGALLTGGGQLYMATARKGFVRLEGDDLRQLSPVSPEFDGAYSIIHGPRGAIFSRGGFAAGRPAGEAFGIFQSDDSNPPASTGSGIVDSEAHDALIIRRLPGDGEDYLVGTGDGRLKRYRGGECIETFDSSNAPLEQGRSGIEVVISDIAIGPEGDWWVYALNAKQELLHRRADGQWAAYASPINPRAYNSAGQAKRAYITLQNKTLWVTSEGDYRMAALPLDQLQEYVDSRGAKGVFRQPIFNENDHKHTVGRKILFSPRGYLWMISGQGLVWSAHPNALLEGGRMKLNVTIGSNPAFTWGNVQLLNELDLTDMIFDSGENLWVGSYAAGLFHIDLKTNDLLHYLTAENSPLPSNHITSLDYNEADGRLYIGTPAGALSVITDSQRPEGDFDRLRVYPNPVRPGFDGLVTVDGLVADAVVKITTTSGDLVRELQSNGGRIHWDLKNGHGQEVVSGVYLLFCSDEKGEKTRVVKLAIIR